MELCNLAGAMQPGLVNGPLLDARFFSPSFIVLGASGSVVLIVDTGNHCIRQLDSAGNVSIFAGTGQPGQADGPRNHAKFHHPRGIAMDHTGTVFVADWGNQAIRCINPHGHVSTLVTGMHFSPHALAVKTHGDIILTLDNSPQIWKVDADGVMNVLAGHEKPGYINGPARFARFSKPTGLVVDQTGAVLVADTDNHCIRKVDADGHVTTIAGGTAPGLLDGQGIRANFRNPQGLALDNNGNVMVADTGNNAIRIMDLSGEVHTFAIAHGQIGCVDKPWACCCAPFALLATSDGSVLVTSRNDHRLYAIRSITAPPLPRPPPRIYTGLPFNEQGSPVARSSQHNQGQGKGHQRSSQKECRPLRSSREMARDFSDSKRTEGLMGPRKERFTVRRFPEARRNDNSRNPRYIPGQKERAASMHDRRPYSDRGNKSGNTWDAKPESTWQRKPDAWASGSNKDCDKRSHEVLDDRPEQEDRKKKSKSEEIPNTKADEGSASAIVEHTSQEMGHIDAKEEATSTKHEEAEEMVVTDTSEKAHSSRVPEAPCNADVPETAVVCSLISSEGSASSQTGSPRSVHSGSPHNSPMPVRPLPPLKSTNQLHQNLSELCNNDLFADVLLVAQGQHITAHRNILAARSPAFHKLLTEPQDDRLPVVVLVRDATATSIRVLLRFLYTEELEFDWLEDDDLMWLMVLCKRYSVPDAYEKCVDHLRTALKGDNVLEWLHHSHTHHLEEAKELALKGVARNFMDLQKGRPTELTDLKKDPDLLYQFMICSLQQLTHVVVPAAPEKVEPVE